MTMRSSDVTFLAREVLPILERMAQFIPDCRPALAALQNRLNENAGYEPPPNVVIQRMSRRADDALRMMREFLDVVGDKIKFMDDMPDPRPLVDELADLEGFAPFELVVSGSRVPYIEGRVFGDGKVTLMLDDRFGFDTDEEEVTRWAPFLADAMAVSAGRTSHGENSYIRNPHGRSGGGDPPPLVGTPLENAEGVNAIGEQRPMMQGDTLKIAQLEQELAGARSGEHMLTNRIVNELEPKAARLREAARLMAGGGLSADQQMMLSAHIRGESPHGGALCPRGCPLENVAKATTSYTLGDEPAIGVQSGER